MPIDYSKYPPNWKTEIRPRILARAGNCCEWCGVHNRGTGRRIADGTWEPSHFGPSRIVLTVAHLDHDPENHDVQDDRLAALCQYCHLRYDAAEKARRRKLKTEAMKSIGLFGVVNAEANQ